ncbi:MAG TPA: hypothetical protein VFD46_01000, partial [Chryseolinea sp.]|nr:hypothetical protein [Chryseolinea sp.]
SALNFEGWLSDLISDERWYEVVRMQNKGKDFDKAVRLVYMEAIADASEFDRTPISEHRKHIGNKLNKMPYAPILSVQTHQVKEELPEEKAQIVTGKERDEWIEKWKEEIKKASDHMSVARLATLTPEQIEEEGKIRAAKKAINYVPPPPEEMELKQRIYDACRSRFKDRKDYWAFQTFMIDGFPVFCESQDQAHEIYIEAISLKEEENGTS